MLYLSVIIWRYHFLVFRLISCLLAKELHHFNVDVCNAVYIWLKPSFFNRNQERKHYVYRKRILAP
jgi:hypothetical protein